MDSTQPNPPTPSDANDPAAFDLLHSGVQRRLWQMGWRELRPFQAQSIRHLLHGTEHLLLTAATASGKTEAAFLPVLSSIADEPHGSVRALYVGPLKALINDQFTRVGDLCGHLDVPVYHWHGDVSALQKAKLIANPGGVLLTTPESLESLFVNRAQFLDKLFGGLRFVVIDELHSFLDSARGLHLRSLLLRLRGLVRQPPGLRMIGLSATIGDDLVARRYLDRDNPERVWVINDHSSDKELKLKLYGYRDSARSQNVEDDDGEQSSRDMERLAADIVGHCRGAANLIFANAKSQVEELADACARLGRAEGLADRFLVHHGSLSAEIREEAEATMKSGAAATTFCSSTLEMGVDIGSVKMVGQVGTPWSVASLKQRLGRGGRREGEPRILRMYVECQEPDAKSDLFDRLHLELVQAVAITELMLGHWVEPPSPPACDLSTLTQQIISAICQSGGARADRLYHSLCSSGAFHDVDKQLFARLLRQLADQDVVEQTPEGDLILGLVGERLRKDKGFYAVFPTPDEYAVLFDGQRLGTLACAPKKDEFLLFAGRRWKVVAVDPDRLEMHVQRSQGRRKPKFLGGGGEVHPEVRRKMREVLSTAAAYRYLDASAAALLEDARRAAKSSGVCGGTIVPLGPMQTALMTWTGTRAVLTLQAMLAVAKVETENQGIALVIHQPPDRVAQLVRKCSDVVHDPLTVARHISDAPERKYNWLLGRDLLWEQGARGWVDLGGALRAISGLPDAARA